jgi:hypothetical protein
LILIARVPFPEINSGIGKEWVQAVVEAAKKAAGGEEYRAKIHVLDSAKAIDHIRTHYTEDQIMEEVNNYPHWRENPWLDLDGESKGFIEVYVFEPF